MDSSTLYAAIADTLRAVSSSGKSEDAEKEPSPTEFFGAFISVLESEGEEATDVGNSALGLLLDCVKFVPTGVIARKVDEVLRTLRAALEKRLATPAALALSLKCVGEILCAAPAAEFSRPLPLQSYDALLRVAFDEGRSLDETVRKAAYDAVMRALSVDRIPQRDLKSPQRSLTRNILDALDAKKRHRRRNAVNFLGRGGTFLVWRHAGLKAAKSVLERLFMHEDTFVPAMYALKRAVLDIVIGSSQDDANDEATMKTIKSTVGRMAQLACSHDAEDARAAANKALSGVLNALPARCSSISVRKNAASIVAATASNVVIIDPVTLGLCASIYKCASAASPAPAFLDDLAPLLRTLADTADRSEDGISKKLEIALGSALAYYGASTFLGMVRLRIDADSDRAWLVPLVRDHLKDIDSRLEDFSRFIMPAIDVCKQRSVESFHYKMLFGQLWSLFPSFCTHATDVASHFNSIAEILGRELSNESDVDAYVVDGLELLLKAKKIPAAMHRLF